MFQFVSDWGVFALKVQVHLLKRFRQRMAWKVKRTMYLCIIFVLCSSCLGKSCTSDLNCSFAETCCNQSSGIGKCARSCTIGKRCTSSLACGSGEFCCLNETGVRQCAKTCIIRKTCNTNQDCISSERCCGAGIKKCARNCAVDNELSCLSDQDCASGHCCSNRTCNKQCDRREESGFDWSVAYGAFFCILFILCFLIGCCRCRCRKAREAEDSRCTTHEEVPTRVISGTIDLENQLQQEYYTQQEQSHAQNSPNHPNHPPPSYYNTPPPLYTDQSLPDANQSIPLDTPNCLPPAYPDQSPPAYQA